REMRSIEISVVMVIFREPLGLGSLEELDVSGNDCRRLGFSGNRPEFGSQPDLPPRGGVHPGEDFGRISPQIQQVLLANLLERQRVRRLEIMRIIPGSEPHGRDPGFPRVLHDGVYGGWNIRGFSHGGSGVKEELLRKTPQSWRSGWLDYESAGDSRGGPALEQ